MSRKNYIILTLLITFINIPILFFIDNTKYEDIGIIIVQLSLGVFFLLTSYLLICKKSFNLLAGMTEKEAERIKNIPEERKKAEKTAKIIGYISVFVAIILLGRILFIIVGILK